MDFRVFEKRQFFFLFTFLLRTKSYTLRTKNFLCALFLTHFVYVDKIFLFVERLFFFLRYSSPYICFVFSIIIFLTFSCLTATVICETFNCSLFIFDRPRTILVCFTNNIHIVLDYKTNKKWTVWDKTQKIPKIITIDSS